MDRGYLDFKRLFVMNEQAGFFITRTKRTTRYRRLYSHPVEKSNGLRCDQTVVLVNFYAKRDYPDKLRVVKYVDPETEKRFAFLTNNFDITAQTVADLYRLRWRVELFFKWIKQHLRIKAFFGTSENAVKTQIWIVISVYAMIAILKKRLALDDVSLYTILQILSVTLFEKTPILQALSQIDYKNIEEDLANQLDLFDY
jgi:IS4 transposase